MLKKLLLVLLSVAIASMFGCTLGKLKVTVQFDAIEGLKVDDPVVFEQNRIGVVRSIRYTTQGNYLVGILVERSFKNALTVDSVIFVDRNPAAPGQKAVVVELPIKGGAPLANNALVVGSAKPPYWQQMLERLRQGAGDVEEGLRGTLDEMKRQYGSQSREIDRELEIAIAEVTRRLQELEEAIRQAPDSAAAQELQRTMELLAAELARLQQQLRQRVDSELLPALSEAVAELHRRLEELGRQQQLKGATEGPENGGR